MTKVVVEALGIMENISHKELTVNRKYNLHQPNNRIIIRKKDKVKYLILVPHGESFSC